MLDLEPIEALLTAATAGPWHVRDETDGVYAGQQTVVAADAAPEWRKRVVTVDQTRAHDPNHAANVAFIAAAPGVVRDLLREVRLLRAALALADGALARIVMDTDEDRALHEKVIQQVRATAGMHENGKAER